MQAAPVVPLPANRRVSSLTDFFSAAEARLDHWRELHRISMSLARGSADQRDSLGREAEGIVYALEPLERYCAYPGPVLMAALRRVYDSGNMRAFSSAVSKISAALVTGSYREDPAAWELETEAHLIPSEMLPPAAAGVEKHKPYFEVLVVTAADRSHWPEISRRMLSLRRQDDRFVYQPVIVGSLEDALIATILNYNLQSIVIYDGFSFESDFALPEFRRVLGRYLPEHEKLDPSKGLGTQLARLIKGIRPELDIFLLSDCEVEKLAGSDRVAPIRRIFYAVEELLEIHLSILEGISERFDTPYFDNLKRYAQRPIGTFHALPVARGKSIFKSNWIRDMGEFYGPNLFLAESSATTGGLDSLLEPTGNIKVAQEHAARAFGADRSFFVTNGTSTSNKIVAQALLRPGDIVLIDRDCHKSHHYGLVLAGAQPYYIDAYPIQKYSMYGSVPIRRIKEALLTLRAEGKLEKAKMLVLTNSTFDGHLANVRRTMEECLAIKPDLIFLWDEAWSGFARFSPFLRRRTAMGAAAAIRAMLADPAYRERYRGAEVKASECEPDDPKLLDSRLLPEPHKTRVRVYQTNSIHKSMSCLRQGSIILVADDDYHSVEEPFHEAFFTHTSTSPNLQIIASIDVARRQMELEGYELVMRAIQLSMELRREINRHPLIARYFRALTPAEMIPAEYRQSGYADYGPPDGTWEKAWQALDEDEFFLDPTRITLMCGKAGMNGSEFKTLLAEQHDVQINKTSRNSVLVQININNTRSDLAHLIKALADISATLDRRLAAAGEDERRVFRERVKSLVDDYPDLPDFSRFHSAFRDSENGRSAEGHMREAFYAAYDAGSCEHVKLFSKEIDERLEGGPELVSANFVIPYPPGFPIMVPGQVITKEIVTYMRKLDVKEIHGYTAVQGLKLISPKALERMNGNGHGSVEEAK